ncbi:MAG TPA: hypothetical protein VMG99_08900 [Thermoplasmata archaeon]|nr:hypothetical protein [Thermoplasmata archaeon]
MRTKECEGVLRLDVCRLDPRPELYLCYDGLTGISKRSLLRDILDELERLGQKTAFLAAVRGHSAQVHVYFHDYVSYGVGGGDATSEYYFRTLLLLHEPHAQTPQGAVPEHLAVLRSEGWERLSLE